MHSQARPATPPPSSSRRDCAAAWVVEDRAALLEVYGDADAMRWVGDGAALSPGFVVRLVTTADRQLLERVDDDGDALLQRGVEFGCREAWVATEAGNASACGLYRALGGDEDAEPAVVYTFTLA